MLERSRASSSAVDLNPFVARDGDPISRMRCSNATKTCFRRFRLTLLCIQEKIESRMPSISEAAAARLPMHATRREQSLCHSAWGYMQMQAHTRARACTYPHADTRKRTSAGEARQMCHAGGKEKQATSPTTDDEEYMFGKANTRETQKHWGERYLAQAQAMCANWRLIHVSRENTAHTNTQRRGG